MATEEKSFVYEEGNEPKLIPLLPLKNIVMLPRSVLPIIVGRASSIQAVEYALKHDRVLFVSTQRDQVVETPGAHDVYTTGSRATILQVMRMPNGALKILVESLSRAKIVESGRLNGFVGVLIQDLPNTYPTKSIELEALWRHVSDLYLSYAKLNDKVPTELAGPVKTTDEMDAAADTLAVHINLSSDERQEILELADLKERLGKIATFLRKEIEILQTETRIRGRIQSQVERNQREYYLTEQIKAIHKELGREDQATELEELRKKLKSIGLSEEAFEKTDKEIRKLEQMPPMSSEAVVSRNYIDWILALPWSKQSKDRISLDQAEKILDQAHAGLQKPKERILEFIAAKKFSTTIERSPILCLVGPPGVGKTSLGQSIAKSLGREFIRISLGGIRDEAEIRGHRRTYIGALPGKIIQAMRKAKTLNPVILLDEIDKMSRDVHGDPGSALLEVLDPEQNKAFVDHYLEVSFDLSKVMFITTANMMEGIPYPLFDRMELITLSGYTEVEKVEIARHFLIPKSLREHGLKGTQFKLSDVMIHKIINDHTKEAGVRQLERVIAKLIRKTIQVLLNNPATKSVSITEDLIREWLGYPKFKKTSLDQQDNRTGLATGLAWTEFGGDVLEIETTVLSGKGGMTLTGQLGEVMQESAYAALSYIRSRAQQLGLKASFYSNKDIHIHIPEGATPKDGPSAGITMCTALVSALTKNPTASGIAMTGEITLRGNVLAIGGLKEKLLAAKQHGIKTVLIPKENSDDLAEVLKEVKLDDLEVVSVSTMDEVLARALRDNPFAKALEKNGNGNGNNKKKKKLSSKKSKKADA